MFNKMPMTFLYQDLNESYRRFYRDPLMPRLASTPLEWADREKNYEDLLSRVLADSALHTLLQNTHSLTRAELLAIAKKIALDASIKKPSK